MRVGKTREKLSRMIFDQLGYTAQPEDMWMNGTPWAKQMDLARWGCTASLNGLRKNIHSWSRMGDIVKSGKIAIVMEDSVSIEICEGS